MFKYHLRSRTFFECKDVEFTIIMLFIHMAASRYTGEVKNTIGGHTYAHHAPKLTA